MIGVPVAQRRRDEPAAAEALQLVAVAVVLADALEALREDADQLAAAQQPLGVRRAGQRRAGLAGQLGQERHPEHQVGAEQAEVARGSAARRGSRAESISASSAIVPEWLRDDEAGPIQRHVLGPGHLDPEPVAVERLQQRLEDAVGQLRVEAELVDVVLRRSGGGAGTRAHRPPARPRCPAPGRPCVRSSRHRSSAAQSDHRRSAASTLRRSPPAARSAPDAGSRPAICSAARAPAATPALTPRAPAGSATQDGFGRADRVRRQRAIARVPAQEVGERGRRAPRLEAELLDQAGRVDHPAVHEQVELVEAELARRDAAGESGQRRHRRFEHRHGEPAGPAYGLGQRDRARRRRR